MSLDREIASMRRRLKKVLPIASPPQLKMNIFQESDYKHKKIPVSQSPWEINLIVEADRYKSTVQIVGSRAQYN